MFLFWIASDRPRMVSLLHLFVSMPHTTTLKKNQKNTKKTPKHYPFNNVLRFTQSNTYLRPLGVKRGYLKSSLRKWNPTKKTARRCILNGDVSFCKLQFCLSH